MYKSMERILLRRGIREFYDFIGPNEVAYERPLSVIPNLINTIFKKNCIWRIPIFSPTTISDLRFFYEFYLMIVVSYQGNWLSGGGELYLEGEALFQAN